jgi:PAS domain S-box-containing protein
MVVFCVALSLTGKGRSITDYYLAGFAGLAQLTPGMLAATYLPGVNRRGFLAGLIAGMLLWLITIALPLLFGDWTWQLPMSDKTIQVGMQNWSIWAIEALLVNITLCTVFSVFSAMDSEQKTFASLCMVDNVYIPARIEIAQKSVDEITTNLRLSLGDDADNEVLQALETLGLQYDEVRPAALRQLRDTINASLNMRFGVLAANRIMEKSLPVTIPNANDPDDIYLIESMLAIHGDRLTGIASELNKLRMHHREIINNLPIGVISVDPNGEVVKWNSTIARYTGLDSDMITGSSISELPQPWGPAITNFIASDANMLDDLQLEIQGEVRWFSLQRSARQINPDTDIVVLVEEHTSAVNLIQQSIDNERLASVGRLAAGVAHEIGNPVTGIACLAQNLQHETDSNEIEYTAEQILSQTQRINRIVQSLLSFSRGGSPIAATKQTIYLQHAAKEAINLLTMSASQIEVTFSTEIDDELAITGDYHHLIQIFLNLLSNSRDASPAGGVISIKANRTDHQVELKISDEGLGIDDKVKGHLFEPFVTNKDPGSGTGLGLWVVINLVNSMGGDISIVSPAENNQHGTTATISFPLSSAS